MHQICSCDFKKTLITFRKRAERGKYPNLLHDFVKYSTLTGQSQHSKVCYFWITDRCLGHRWDPAHRRASEFHIVSYQSVEGSPVSACLSSVHCTFWKDEATGWGWRVFSALINVTVSGTSTGLGAYSLRTEPVADCCRTTMAPLESVAKQMWGSREFLFKVNGREQAVCSYFSS